MPTWIRCSARLLTLSVTGALGARAAAAQNRAQVASPDGRNRVTVEIRDGALTYNLDRDGRAVFLPSRLGFAFQGAPPLRDSLRMVDTSRATVEDRKSTRLNSSHRCISYAVFCLKKKKTTFIT